MSSGAYQRGGILARNNLENRSRKPGLPRSDPSKKNGTKAGSEEHDRKHENARDYWQRLAAPQMRSGYRERAQPRNREGQQKVGGHGMA